MWRLGWLTLAVLMLMDGQAFAVPLPPPPPEVLEKASKIATSPALADIAAYGALFSPDVRVYFNGELIAEERRTWLKLVADPSAPRMHVMRLATGNPIIAIEQVSTVEAPSFKNNISITHDCCVWARTVTFHLNDKGEVDEVRIAEGQTGWMQPPADNGRR